MSGTIGIGFQGSSVGMMWMPEWVKNDRATRVIRVAFYAKAGRPLFVLLYQIWGMNGVGRFPCVIAFRVSPPPVKATALMCNLHILVVGELPE